MAALGAFVILSYAVLGMMLMTDWAVTAGSGRPLAETIIAMQEERQPYSTIPGIIFAAAGAALALGWMSAVLLPRFALPAAPAIAIWGAILAFGAPAYFYLSFGNMNSVGDTFYDWNADAAFALVMPLYLTSGLAAVAAIIGVAVTAVRAGRPASR